LAVRTFDEVWPDLLEVSHSPALKIMQTKHLLCYMTLVSCAFETQADRVEDERFRSRCEAAYRELRKVHPEMCPSKDGEPQEIVDVINYMRRGDSSQKHAWVRTERRDGICYWQMTPAAALVLRFAESMTDAIAVVTETRMSIIADLVDKTHASLSDNRDTQREYLVRMVEQAERNLREFDEGSGDVVNEDRLREQTTEIVRLLQDIPPALVDLRDATVSQRRDAIAQLRGMDPSEEEMVVKGVWKDRYDLLKETDAGRSYLDAYDFMASDRRFSRFNEKVSAICRSKLLDAEERSTRWQEMTDVWHAVEVGMVEVQDEHRRQQADILDYVQMRRKTDARTMEEALRRLEELVVDSSRRPGGPAAASGMDCPAEAVKAFGVPAEPLHVVGIRPLEAVDLAEEHVLDEEELRSLRARGGPHTRKVLARIREAPILTTNGDVDLADSFSTLPVEERRSIECIGILESLMSSGAWVETHETARWECFDGEGRRCVWETPKMVVSPVVLEMIVGGDRDDG